MNELKEGLQLLRQNPNVRQVNAELKPGAAPGEGVLDVRVADQQPFRVGLQADNHRPPSVGAEEISLLASDLNLTGHSDALQHPAVECPPLGVDFIRLIHHPLACDVVAGRTQRWHESSHTGQPSFQ